MTEPPDDLGWVGRLATVEEKVRNLEKLADQVEALKWMIIKAAILVIIGTVSVGKALEMVIGK